mgnify:CR=1 FL=1
MQKWRLIGNTWCIWPSKPKGIIEMIGGSYLASTPQLSYRRLLEGLSKKGLAIHAWRYLPGFDHQLHANQAWKEFRECKEALVERIGEPIHCFRLGHSLGCKLHLLSPDLGRNSKSLIALSFNNYKADKSIPMLSKFKRKLNIESEFSPSPFETMKLISRKYLQVNNLLIKFKNDNLDQTNKLIKSLKSREIDKSRIIQLDGDHLTPASIGIRKAVLGEFSKNDSKTKNINLLIKTINNYFSENQDETF